MLQERNKAQDALKESEERLNLAIGATGQGLWDWNLENNMLLWDLRAYEIFSRQAVTVVTRWNGDVGSNFLPIPPAE